MNANNQIGSTNNNHLLACCFRVETSYGDARPSWYVYRRVRKVIAGYAECHRFERRCDGAMVVYFEDCIRIEMLTAQERVPIEQWRRRWEQFQKNITECWFVE